jgi:hypothetical protein
MSKLSDSIRKASRVEPAPLGFAAAAARPAAPTLVCLVRLSKGDAGKAEEAAKRGADGVIVERLDAAKAKDVVKKAGAAFVGAAVSDASRGDVVALRDAGTDFAVFSLESVADAMLEEKIGLVLSLSAEADDTTLRLLGDMGLDALIVPGPGEKLSVQELLGFRRLAALARTPLLTEVKADADADLLQALREAGVAGVIVEASGIGKLEGLRERIAALPARGKQKEEKAEVMVPAGAVAGGGNHEHEDDDE